MTVNIQKLIQICAEHEERLGQREQFSDREESRAHYVALPGLCRDTLGTRFEGEFARIRALAVQVAPGQCLIRATYQDHQRIGYRVGFLGRRAATAFRRRCAEAGVPCA